MNDWRQGSYIYQRHKLKKKSFKMILKLNIISYFNILDPVEYLEIKYFLLENSFKYKYFFIKKEQNKILMEIERIKKKDYLKLYDSDSDYSYTDDSGSNASDYSDSNSDDESDLEFTQ